jgi:hypothetical protein
MAKTNWYCEATVTYWDHNQGDYCEVQLDHYSGELTREQAEYDARETWNEHGYNPDRIAVKKYE